MSPRPRNEEPTYRWTITIPAVEALELRRYAEAHGFGRVGTAAGYIVTQAMRRIHEAPVEEQDRITELAGELRRERRRVEELEWELARARRSATEAMRAARRMGTSDGNDGEDQEAEEARQPQPTPAAEGMAARWEMPMGPLLEDGEWWDRWLPRLAQTLGRRYPPEAYGDARDPGRQRQPPTEGRGYIDLLAHLFPPIRVDVEGEEREITWRMVEYPAYAYREAVDPETGEIKNVSAYVWEPVVRLVAEACAALEGSGDAAHGDPWARMQLREWVQTRWLESLQIVLGTQNVERLPARPATEVGLERHLRTGRPQVVDSTR